MLQDTELNMLQFNNLENKETIPKYQHVTVKLSHNAWKQKEISVQMLLYSTTVT